MTETIKVLLVDDQPRVRLGLKMSLALEPDIQVVGEAGDGASVLEMVQELQPDVVVMDVVMPKLDGIAATQALVSLMPKPVVIMLSLHDDPHTRARALAAGAAAFVVKRSGAAALVEAIRQSTAQFPSRGDLR
jgi:DNA-binding NarL/FixJ family response regulator